MKRVTLTRLAEADLDKIWHYTLEKWGVDQAEHYVGTIRARLQGAADAVIADQPSGLSDAPYRTILAGSHNAVFIRREEGIEVVRILHDRMDTRRHLK